MNVNIMTEIRNINLEMTQAENKQMTAEQVKALEWLRSNYKTWKANEAGKTHEWKLCRLGGYCYNDNGHENPEPKKDWKTQRILFIKEKGRRTWSNKGWQCEKHTKETADWYIKNQEPNPWAKKGGPVLQCDPAWGANFEEAQKKGEEISNKPFRT